MSSSTVTEAMDHGRQIVAAIERPSVANEPSGVAAAQYGAPAREFYGIAPL